MIIYASPGKSAAYSIFSISSIYASMERGTEPER